jgi:hypothetical protein
MNYTKPEVNTLGEATTVIELINNSKPAQQPFEPGKTVHPAYDLDE